MSMYSIEFDRKGSKVSSHQFPTFLEVQIPDKHEEVHSSPTMDKNQSEMHSKFQEEEEDPLSYNIDEIFESFTFNFFKKEVSQKRMKNKKKNDATLKKIQEDEVIIEKTEKDPIIVYTTSTTLSEATSHNATILSDKLSQAESDNDKLKNKIISLKAEVNKRRKVESDTTPLQANILEQ